MRPQRGGSRGRESFSRPKRGRVQKNWGGDDNPNNQPLGDRSAVDSEGDRKPSSSFSVFDRFKDLEDIEREEIKQLQMAEKKKSRPNNFDRAHATYQKIQLEKNKEREDRKKDKEAREKAIEQYQSTKKKMNKALKRKNKKGQPNLNVQVEVLLEKIQKKM